MRGARTIETGGAARMLGSLASPMARARFRGPRSRREARGTPGERRARRRLRAGACALAALWCAAAPARAEEGPRKLRHLLRYVSADYRHAVRDGQVQSRAEYEEQLLLLSDAQRLSAALPREAEAVKASVARVRGLVERKEAEREVVRAVAAAEAMVVGAFRLRDQPASEPDLARGAALFGEHCATCHGAAGRGDTARARSLSPPPPDFHDPALGEGLSPLRVASAVELGIEGTSMVPFTFLSGQDRWDLAFFVTGLRHAGQPHTDRVPSFSLAELSGATDGELLDHLYSAGAEEQDLAPMLAVLRTDPRAPRPGGLRGARAAWDEARLLWTWGDTAPARGALLHGIHEAIALARGRLATSAPEVASSVEQRAVLALAAASDGSPKEGFATAMSALLVEATRAELAATAGAQRGIFARAVTGAWAFLLGCGPGWLAVAAASARGALPRIRRGLSAAALVVTLVWAVPLFAVAASGVGLLFAASAGAGATAMLSVVAALASRSARVRRTGAALVLAGAAAVAAGQCVHAGQLAGVLPAHAVGSDLVLFPLANGTWETICLQVAFFVGGLAALLPRRGGPSAG